VTHIFTHVPLPALREADSRDGVDGRITFTAPTRYHSNHQILRGDPRGLVSHQLPPIRLFHVDVQIPGVRIDFVALGYNVNLPMTGHDRGVPVNRDLDVVAGHRLILGRPGFDGAKDPHQN